MKWATRIVTLAAAGIAAVGLSVTVSSAANAAHASVDDVFISNTATDGAGKRITIAGLSNQWVGQYRLSTGERAFCIDLNSESPYLATGYVSELGTDIRVQEGFGPNEKKGRAAITGRKLTEAELGQLGYLMYKYADTRDAATAVAVEHAERLITAGDKQQQDREKVRWQAVTGQFPEAATKYKEIATDVARHAGPYSIFMTSNAKNNTRVGTPVTITVRIVSLTSRGLPGIPVTLTVDGKALPRVNTDNDGRAAFTVTPTKGGLLKARATLSNVPNHFPRIYIPRDFTAADKNKQRLVGAADAVQMFGALDVNIEKSTPVVTTKVSHSVSTPGQSITDSVTVTGLVTPYSATATAQLYGPFPAVPTSTSCVPGTLFGTVTFPVNGNGTFTTPSIKLGKGGYYTWVVTLPPNDANNGVVAPCGDLAETTRTVATPTVATVTSSAEASLNASIFDNVTISNTSAGYAASATAILYGPFDAHPNAGSCTSGKTFGSVTFPVNGDGTYQTPSVALTKHGYFTWVIELPATPTQNAHRTPCGIPSETTRVMATPSIVTTTSAATTTVGKDIFDNVTISGTSTSGYKATATAILYGPFDTHPNASSCVSSKQYATVKFAVNGNATYKTPSVKLAKHGFYTWVIALPAGPLQNAVTAECGIPSETTSVMSTPTVTTTTSAATTTVGKDIFDNVTISGTSTSGYKATATAILYGPFDTHPTISSCISGKVFKSVTFAVDGNGKYKTPSVTVTQPGFYTWVIVLPGTSTQNSVTAPCGEKSETTRVMAVPTIVTTTSESVTSVGSAIYDNVTITGAAPGYSGQATAVLYGPFASHPGGKSCVPGKKFGTVKFTVNGAGTYQTPTVKLSKPGFYTWVISLPGAPLQQEATTPCGIPSETTRAMASPTITTTSTSAKPGGKIHDVVKISGLPEGYSGNAVATLYGPFTTKPSLGSCPGTPIAKKTFKVTKNGTYRTPDVSVPFTGVYTWKVELPGSSMSHAVVSDCGIPAESPRIVRPTPPDIIIPTGRGFGLEIEADTFAVAERAKKRPAKNNSGAGRVIIGSQGINAPVLPSGIKSGRMTLPSSYTEAGQLTSGARIGDKLGTILVAGHVSDNSDSPMVFWKLRHVKVGDVISLKNAQGKEQRFVVTETKQRSRKTPVPSSFYAQDVPLRLVLVTCANKVDAPGGGFEYTDNLFVYADPID